MAARELEVGCHGSVYLLTPKFGAGFGDFRLLSAERPGHVDGIAALVHRGPTTQLELEADVGEGRQCKAERGLDPTHLPDLARTDDVSRPTGVRVVTVVKGFHHHEAG